MQSNYELAFRALHLQQQVAYLAENSESRIIKLWEHLYSYLLLFNIISIFSS